MARTNQNQVPYEFDAFYRPILELKRRLQSNAKELGAEQVIQGFVMLHYARFMMCNLYHTLGINTAKILSIRELIELIMQKDSFKLESAHWLMSDLNLILLNI